VIPFARATCLGVVLLVASGCAAEPGVTQVERDFQRAIAKRDKGVYEGKVTRVVFNRGLWFKYGTARVYFVGTCSRFDGTNLTGNCGERAHVRITYELDGDGHWHAIRSSNLAWDLPQ
jgi:hypothetical protein